MSLISIDHLSFTYDGSYEPIFEEMSLTLDSDWKLGFIGRNGRGKTTFLKLLLGQYEYTGTISAQVDFYYFPFVIPEPEVMTYELADEILPQRELWEVQRELSLLALPDDVLYRSFSTLSQGEQTKVMLGLLFLKEDGFLLIDEPTNHLDLAGREIVGKYLNKKKGFILVSHDRHFLDSCIDHVLSINKQDIEIQQGNYSSWQLNKDRADQFELDKNVKLKKEIGHLQAAARRSAGWSDQIEKSKKGAGAKVAGLRPDRGFIGHKSAKMMKRAKVAEGRRLKAAAEKEQLLQNIDWAADLSIKTLRHPKQRLITLREVEILYDGVIINEPFSLEINQGDRIALTGKNGAGKSSLIKLLLGEAIEYRGQVEIASNLKISYVSQSTAHLAGTLDVYAREQGIDEALFKAILRKMGFLRIQFEKDMADFSSGQKKKVLLAHSLADPANLYIWDEPLNYVDILSRQQIEALILAHRPTMVFVEHDKAFTQAVALAVTEVLRRKE